MTCRRCEGLEHHWLPYDGGEDDGSPVPSPMPDFECKHCAAIGDECPSCEVTGAAESILDQETDDDFFGECEVCDGYGVIERKGVVKAP